MADLHHPLTASPVPMVLVDADGFVRDANPASAELLDLTVHDVVGRPAADFIPPEQRPRLAHILSDLMSGAVDAVSSRVAPLRRPDGAVVTLSAWARSVDLVEGRLAILGFDNRQPVEPTRLAAPVRRASLGVIVADHDWRVQDTSVDVGGLFGADTAALTDTPFLDLVHPHDSDAVVVALTHLERHGQAVSVSVRMGGERQWRPVILTVVRMCQHQPPRLALLVSRPQGERPSGGEDAVQRAIGDAVSGHLLADVARAVTARGLSLQDLTGRQWEIIGRLARGESIATMATSMGLTQGTVRNHLSAVFRKLGVRSQAGLLAAIFAKDASGDL
ncbi:MAG TPA: PAS domain-containing protein [Acidimicrobiales bacterium]|nr:PAS domain-containing protein [Acidimicrobiales bacterium]